jgi:16S rRNA (guanine527-N7)-methyltransferase
MKDEGTLLIREWLEEHEIPFTEEQFHLLARFKALVLEANKAFNLTRITSDRDFALKHFVDSFTLLEFLPPKGEVPLSFLDIGTGAGFPGVPVLIARGDLAVTLMDSTAKRINFVKAALDTLGLHARCIHANARELSPLLANEKFDIVTARAVAALDKLAAMALPLVKPGGCFLAMKGQNIDAELQALSPKLKKLRAAIDIVKCLKISNEINHTIISIRKDV